MSFTVKEFIWNEDEYEYYRIMILGDSGWGTVWEGYGSDYDGQFEDRVIFDIERNVESIDILVESV